MTQVWDEIPEWIQRVTYREQFDSLVLDDPDAVLSQLNFLKGAYQGFTYKVRKLEEEAKEADEKFDLARGYQRQLDIQVLKDLRDKITPVDTYAKNVITGITLAIMELELKQKG